MGNCYIENDYICKWQDGRLVSTSYFNHKFKRVLEYNKLPIIRFHDLRHSTVSFLLKQGFTLKEIQEWLGHADISTTANIYIHIDMEGKKI